MKPPLLHGLDLSSLAVKGSPVTGPPLRRNFSRLRGRKNVFLKSVQIVSDETLDGDILSTPASKTRTLVRMSLSVGNISKHVGNEQGISGEDFDMMSERRRSLFEPLGPKMERSRSPESLLPLPDFDSSSYPQGWAVGKRRKLVNVDVVESMRRIAVQEMNRKDREIDGLSEQLDEDAKTMEHLQLQLLQERQKRVQAERENSVLQGQIAMLMNMLNELEGEGEAENVDDAQVINS